MEGPPPTPAPPPPPRWRGWLLIAGLILTVVLFLVPVPSSGKVEQLSYSQLKSDLAAGQVASVAIGPDGDISGKLTNGTKFTSSYPTNLQDPQVTRLLDQHNVQVTTKPAQTSIWSVLLNLLPRAIILSLFIWTGRSARRQLAGMGGIGRARSRVFDAERPDTTFADVAGYAGAKREVTEVVDFFITGVDFAEARDRILLGRRDSSNALLPDEQRAVAVHESGHALVAALSEHGDPVAKVTILPAGQALGVTEQLPIDERHLYTEGYLKDSLAIRMGGRVAEQLVFGQTSTGAANDLAGATDLATRMVREFGMSPALGPVGFASGSPMYLGTEEVRSRPYAEATQRVIDQEVATLLREAEQRATAMLTSHRDALDRLTELLLERETVDGTDVDQVLGRIPGQTQPVGATGHAASAVPADGAGAADA